MHIHWNKTVPSNSLVDVHIEGGGMVAKLNGGGADRWAGCPVV